MESLGEHIRSLREARDLSLRELARSIKVSAAFVSDIELGRRYPSDAVFERIADVLGVKATDLRAYDPRLPIEALKRLAEADPTYGIAFRKIIDQNISSAELLKLADRKAKPKKDP